MITIRCFINWRFRSRSWLSVQQRSAWMIVWLSLRNETQLTSQFVYIDMTVVIVSIILRRASGEERRSGSLLTLLCLVIIWWDPRARILTGAGLPGAGGGGPVVSSLTQSHSHHQTGDTPVSVQCLEVWRVFSEIESVHSLSGLNGLQVILNCAILSRIYYIVFYFLNIKDIGNIEEILKKRLGSLLLDSLDGAVLVASPSGCRLLLQTDTDRNTTTDKMWQHNIKHMMDYLVWCLCLKGV